MKYVNLICQHSQVVEVPFQRHKLGTSLTPVTPESFAIWKQTRMDKKTAEAEAMKNAKSTQAAAGKSSGMSGRDLVSYLSLTHVIGSF